jgi:cytochrome c-type biogenesis protein CcmH/NrfF
MRVRRWLELPVLLRRSNLKLAAIFFVTIAGLIAQDSTSYLTPDVMRVGGRLACRCAGCRNTVGDCPMLHCSSADPKRHRIYDMKQTGMSDNAIVNQIVQEEGIVALASPPSEGVWPIVTWLMPGIALLIGFFIYSSWVKRNKQEPAKLTDADKATLERFKGQIDKEFEDEPTVK